MEITIESIGEERLVREFWECECPTTFVHHKTKPGQHLRPIEYCGFCGAAEEESPDARLENVIEYAKDQIENWTHDGERSLRIEMVAYWQEQLKRLESFVEKPSIDNTMYHCLSTY